MERNLSILGEFVIFNGEDGSVHVQVDLVNETVWMTQKAMAQLFGVEINTINYHLKEVFNSNELQADRTIRKIRIVQNEGGRDVERNVAFYDLDAIISVGYRVNSARATQFRIWATKTLRNYLVNGYVLDSERFKKGQPLTKFKELLEKIREIRVSERVFYQQIKDIYALSSDYDPKADMTIRFFQKVQNKLLWAVSGKTAAELIYYRANAKLPLMGLTSTEITGKVKSTDIGIGKNYLNEQELGTLKLIVEQYLAFAETQAKLHIDMTMKDWIEKLDIILQMNGRELLKNAGKISGKLAIDKAHTEFDNYKEKERIAEKIESLKELEHDILSLSLANEKDKS